MRVRLRRCRGGRRRVAGGPVVPARRAAADAADAAGPYRVGRTRRRRRGLRPLSNPTLGPQVQSLVGAGIPCANRFGAGDRRASRFSRRRSPGGIIGRVGSEDSTDDRDDAARPGPRHVDRWGIQLRWVGADNQTQTVADDVVRTLRETIGEPPDDLESRAPVVTRPGRELGLGTGEVVEVVCEDGERRSVDGTLPDDFPLGYHRVLTADGHDRLLVVSPGRCWLPEGWRAWGWTVQLYA